MELNNYLSKDTTPIIKGYAILFMIAHHVLIKEFYVNQPEILTNIFSIRLQIGMKMCVGLFTFFVGYGAFYAKELTFRYIFKHIWRLLKCYWLILLVTISIAYIANVSYDMSVTLLNFVGLMSQYNLGNWYVYFYIFLFIILVLLRCGSGGKLGISTDIVFVPLFILSVTTLYGGAEFFSQLLYQV